MTGVGIALEQRFAIGSFGDMRARVGYLREHQDPTLGANEVYDRVTTEIGWSRSIFHGIKADVGLVDSLADIDRRPGGHDRDQLWAANLRLIDYRDADASQPIDPRGTEYKVGVVRGQRTYRAAPDVELRRDTIYAGLKLREMLGGSIDAEVLANYFRTEVAGVANDRDSESVEANLIATWRAVDRVNRFVDLDVERIASVTQAGVNLRPF